MTKLYCDNKKCMHNIMDTQQCSCNVVYYVRKLCMTFKRRPADGPMRDLMRTFSSGLDKDRHKTTRIQGVLK